MVAMDNNDFKSFSELTLSIGITRNEYAQILGISKSSLYKYLKDYKLPKNIEGRFGILSDVITKGISVFGSKKKFSTWLRMDNIVLNTKPINLLKNLDGANRVLNILGRIEHGIYS